METAELKRFAQGARQQLLDQVGARLEQVLSTDSVEIREKQKVVDELQKQINQRSKGAVVDRVAYTWFNRFCALRFMDVNHYTRVGVVSPTQDFTQPEILQEAKQGVFDESLKVDRERVQDLLNGNIPSSNPQQEAYRLLLVGACNAYHDMMPFLFEEIDDYTDLLMPDDLLSENSVLHNVREALTSEACQDVEVIGWLYQYYISERKDEVFANLRRNKKIQPEDIPAATQLFTPHWIVRYLVENSLGRLWMLNHPESKLVDQMDYYIRPEQEEIDFLKIGSPEEIKICDPACGSGHMLTYAFDLLYAIYEEQGYDPIEIPSFILSGNLYGIEIDERAGDLTAFALMMKARGRDKRFFDRNVEPNVCVLESVHFSEEELDQYMDAVGRDLFAQELLETLNQFEYADNFGSLIQPKVKDVTFIRQRIEEHGLFEDLFLHQTSQNVLKVLEQAEYLDSRYHVVVTNPPYMGGKGMNVELKVYAKDNFPDTKSGLGVMFIERNLGLVKFKGLAAIITMESWMFLLSYEKFRNKLLARDSILSMAHLGTGAFDTIGGAVVSTTAFVLKNASDPNTHGSYIRLISGRNEAEKQRDLLDAIHTRGSSWLFHTSAADLKKIPGYPIAYWASDKIRELFSITYKSLENITISDGQTKTGNNGKYLRYHWELNSNKIGKGNQWLHHPKGGPFRKWYGNVNWVIDWSEGARKHYRSDKVARILPEYLWSKAGITWTLISQNKIGFRLLEKDHIFNLVSPSLFFTNDKYIPVCLGLLNTKLSSYILEIINPTLATNIGEIRSIPYVDKLDHDKDKFTDVVNQCVNNSRIDWNSHEPAWEFLGPEILNVGTGNGTFAEKYKKLRQVWWEISREMQKLEEENNRYFIDSYGLENEFTPEVQLNQITLYCNTYYRYPETRNKTYTDAEREAMLLEDTMKEFISYAVGCMFGRYSLDKPGLILANQGETAEDYREQLPDPTFPPDEDNVIPILDEGWFPDAITERFKNFLRITFGNEHYEENLTFLEDAIGRDIRSFFLKDFYKEHVKMYKKRPIYWMFSSPKGSFNALIYMHRYRPDTISIILNDYLRVFREKLNAHKAHLLEVEGSANASSRERTKALKEIEKLNGILNEIMEYEDEILYPLATQKIDIDLDDGVKVNYKKFGKALKHVSGLSK